MQGGPRDTLHCFQLACIKHAYINTVIVLSDSFVKLCLLWLSGIR